MFDLALGPSEGYPPTNHEWLLTAPSFVGDMFLDSGDAKNSWDIDGSTFSPTWDGDGALIFTGAKKLDIGDKGVVAPKYMKISVDLSSSHAQPDFIYCNMYRGGIRLVSATELTFMGFNGSGVVSQIFTEDITSIKTFIFEYTYVTSGFVNITVDGNDYGSVEVFDIWDRAWDYNIIGGRNDAVNSFRGSMKNFELEMR